MSDNVQTIKASIARLQELRGWGIEGMIAWQYLDNLVFLMAEVERRQEALLQILSLASCRNNPDNNLLTIIKSIEHEAQAILTVETTP